MNLLIQNKAARLKLNEVVHKDSIDRLVTELGKVFGAKAFEDGLVSGEITNCIENAADTLDIDINSPGGSVLDGYVLYNAIKEMRARGVYVTAHVSLAASMASVIAMAANKIVMKTGSRMMIHEASAGTHGDADEHRNRAELLEGISDEIAAIYANRTGKKKEEMRAMMKKETWMDGKKAVAMGFADEFDTETKTKAMNLIERLLKLGDNEATEQVKSLEAQISAHDEVVNGLNAEIESLKASVEASTTELVELKAAKASADELLAAKDAEIKAQADEIAAKQAEFDAAKAELEKAAEVSQEKVAAKAAELLAQTGHQAPVAIEGEGESRSHLEIFSELKGAAASAYWKANQKEIQKEIKARQK